MLSHDLKLMADRLYLLSADVDAKVARKLRQEAESLGHYADQADALERAPIITTNPEEVQHGHAHQG